MSDVFFGIKQKKKKKRTVVTLNVIKFQDTDSPTP